VAIGRSPSKLGLARDLGAEIVDASNGDPVLGVRRLTRGQGVHAVFELVASEESMPAALGMLRRRGRLVFVGYSSARLRLNPLELVLRETQVLSSLGNTRAELREVVALAASGALEVPIAGQYALEDVASVLAALRAGELVGRAVVVPSARPRLFAPAGAAERTSALATTFRKEDAAGEASREELHVILREVPMRCARRLASRRAGRPKDPLLVIGVGVADPSQAQDDIHATTPEKHLEQELLAFVGRGVDGPRDDAEFNDLALRLFAYQFANNRPYRLLAERRGRTPATVGHWREIPAVPIAAFKETLLAAEPIDGAVEFNSSGTTRPEHKSRHFHPDLTLYNLNAQLNFKAHVLPDRDRMRLLVLFPPRDELPNSSLAHWLTLMVERFGAPGSGWFVSNTAGLDAPGLLAVLETAEEPVGVLAASFGLVHFLEYCQDHGASVSLPPGSRVMDTGGYKGRSREYARDELYAMVTERLGVPASHIVNMYGMTEHGTQFLDAVLRDHLAARDQAPERYKVVPPWARTLVVDPDTMAEQPAGERGLLLHVDLINRASAVCVLSEDVGHTVGGGFELLGRAQGSEARGCSIALDELLEAVHGGAR
jgi:Zinc-binding dehydrogenase/Acyl-protein synthetase, LuxE